MLGRCTQGVARFHAVWVVFHRQLGAGTGGNSVHSFYEALSKDRRNNSCAHVGQRTRLRTRACKHPYPTPIETGDADPRVGEPKVIALCEFLLCRGVSPSYLSNISDKDTAVRTDTNRRNKKIRIIVFESMRLVRI